MANHTNWSSIRGNWRRLALGIGATGLVAAAFSWGRTDTLPRAGAFEPPAKSPDGISVHASEYSTRAVASIFGNETLTREEFGEYLIARERERLENFINKRIIEHACKAKGIDVTSGEIDASLQTDIDKLQVSPRDFLDRILKHYHKTLFEWKEDVVRPRLLMTKLVKDQVQVVAEDVRKGYESYYGEKIDCKIIMWDKKERQKIELEVYSKIRDNDAAFETYAKQQASTKLAANAGHLDQPIARWSTANEQFENVVFALQPGEVSRIIEQDDFIVAVKCIKHIPADTSVSLESVRAKLEKEIREKKTQLMIPVVFNKLREEANVQSFLDPHQAEEDAFRRMTREQIKDVSPALVAPGGL